jgi:hypothetical protein
MSIHQCAPQWATLLTTKMRFGNVTPRIVNGVKSGGRSLLRGKVTWGHNHLFRVSAARKHASEGVGPTGDKVVPMLGSLSG